MDSSLGVEVALQVGVLVVLFFMAVMVNLAETALIGLDRIKILSLIRNKHKASDSLKIWIKEPNNLLSTLLVWINIVAVSASSIGAFIAMELSKAYPAINEIMMATMVEGVIAFIIIGFGEITPKIYAIHRTEKTALALIGPTVILHRFTAPVTMLFVAIANQVVKLFGVKPKEALKAVSDGDLNNVIDVSADAGFIDEQARIMMSSLLEFKGLQAKHIMVPRTALTGIDIDWALDKIIDVVTEEGYSRMPVYKNNLDNVVGILYTKDMLIMIKNRGLVILHDLMRIPYFVPETKKLSDLLKEFKKGHVHIAVVVDEFGGTSGIVTMEDILEEIVGEIKDEYDMEEKEIEVLAPGVFTMRGNTEIGKINDFCKIEIPDESDINTIGGFVSSLAGNVPKEGEKIVFSNITFTVLKSDVKRLVKLKIEIMDKEKNI